MKEEGSVGELGSDLDPDPDPDQQHCFKVRLSAFIYFKIYIFFIHSG